MMKLPPYQSLIFLQKIIPPNLRIKRRYFLYESAVEAMSIWIVKILLKEEILFLSLPPALYLVPKVGSTARRFPNHH